MDGSLVLGVRSRLSHAVLRFGFRYFEESMRTVLEKPVVSAEEAVSRIEDGQTVAVGGSGSGHCIPDVLLAALGRRCDGHSGKDNGASPLEPMNRT